MTATASALPVWGNPICYRPGTVRHQDKQTSSSMSHECRAADPSSLSNPRVSECLIGIIKQGYLLQFARRPPHFSSVVSTSVQSENAHVLCSEVMILLEKGAIEIVPPAQSESGFYSHYFLDPKKDGGPRPILDLRCLNCALIKRLIRLITLRKILHI